MKESGTNGLQKIWTFWNEIFFSEIFVYFFLQTTFFGFFFQPLFDLHFTTASDHGLLFFSDQDLNPESQTRRHFLPLPKNLVLIVDKIPKNTNKNTNKKCKKMPKKNQQKYPKKTRKIPKKYTKVPRKYPKNIQKIPFLLPLLSLLRLQAHLPLSTSTILFPLHILGPFGSSDQFIPSSDVSPLSRT